MNLKRFETFIIGSTKINKIKNDYPNTIFIWIDKINNEPHFLPFTDDLLNIKDEVCNGSYVKYIIRSGCMVGKMNLLAYIHSLINETKTTQVIEPYNMM